MKKTQREHAMGSGGECICPKCEASVPHQQGVPCQEEHCPNCGAKMLRVGSRHHQLWLAKHTA
jgi:predicted amidophosphoribosyltransferase